MRSWFRDGKDTASEAGGLVATREPKNFESVPVLSKDHPGYGVNGEGSLYIVKTSEDGKPKPYWICDGYARISEEMRRENGDAVFIIEGWGAKDGHAFKFEMNAADFAESRKLKGKLTAQFGAVNRVGGLTGDIIQQISLDVKKFRLIETPRWLDGKAAVPGLDLIPNLRYATNPRIPVKVGGGNLEDAQQCLRDLLFSWDRRLTTVIYAAVLSAPIVARWYPGERFGMVLRAVTGSGKTEFIKNAMGTYGKGYLNEDNLMRWGAGATTNALMKAAATSGFLPFLVDNYKPIKRDDPANLIGMIQAVLEGSDKARLTSDSEFKDSLKFACTLLITGEDFPEESSTMARCLVVDWSQIQSSERLTRAQGLAHNLPALGKEWLTWLSENASSIGEIFGDYDRLRSDLYAELSVFDTVNSGRLSTSITMLRLVWKIASKCPAFSDILPDFDKEFEEGVESLLKRSPAEINAANEAEDFVDTLNELIGTGQVRLVKDGTDNTGFRDVVGWVRPDGEVCIFPKTARKLAGAASPATQKLSAMTLHKQLDQRGYIKTETKDGKIERTLIRKFNGKTNRVLVFMRGITAPT